MYKCKIAFRNGTEYITNLIKPLSILDLEKTETTIIDDDIKDISIELYYDDVLYITNEKLK